jgi:hypothetical protein
MDAILYVCLPRSEARSSLQARKKVCEYLTDEGFAPFLRFGGRCDYFTVGGHWSGLLPLLRLRSEHPKVIDRIWKEYLASSSSDEFAGLCRRFRETFPTYRGKLPICRKCTEFYGYPDDAQIMDEPLFQQLKGGFDEMELVEEDSDEITKPNVIFIGILNEDEWPKTPEEAAKFWVVVIHYHGHWN